MGFDKYIPLITLGVMVTLAGFGINHNIQEHNRRQARDRAEKYAIRIYGSGSNYLDSA